MIVVIEKGYAYHNMKLVELADEVWTKQSSDLYECVKQRRATHTHHNPGTTLTYDQLLSHLKAAKTFPVGTLPGVVVSTPKGMTQYPLTPDEAFAPKKGVAERYQKPKPGGSPRSITRSALRELIRDVYAQGAKDGDLLAGSFPISDREVDDLLEKFSKKSD
jgi:hypothetical protein